MAGFAARVAQAREFCKLAPPMTLNITLDLLDKMRAIAERAGVEILKIYRAGFAVETKADASPVTRA